VFWRFAVHGRKRGRPKGSGLGQKRKLPHEYSTNPNTMKSRKRYEGMTQHQLAVHAANAADATAVSRNKKKLIKSAQYQAMTEAGKKAALEDVKERILNERFVHSPL
jgi:uridylate kinase